MAARLRFKLLLSMAYQLGKLNFGNAKNLLMKFLASDPSPSLTAEEQDKIQKFLINFFETCPLGSVVQVGANDGIMCDPLRPFIPKHKGKIVLVEPLPYYYDKLDRLYAHQDNVMVVNALIASSEGQRNLYFIEPSVADAMDGDGPMNMWAHGQGSFSKDTVISTILKNEFRGEHYRKNITKYIDAISMTTVNSITLANLLKEYSVAQCNLLVVDVQGAELEVLSSLNELENLPQYILYEDDSSLNSLNRKKLEELLSSLNYSFIAGNLDKLWGLGLNNR